MSLNTLKLTNFRNFANSEIDFSPTINFLVGNNGSGKTNLLEAIYFLTHGRSFRSQSIQRIIAFNALSFILYGKFTDQLGLSSYAGIEKKRQGIVNLKINGSEQVSILDLVNIQPLLIINPATFQLLDAGPQYRRQFMDWGLFHVEHQFFVVWKRVQRALKQRNAALKNKVTNIDAKIWDKELVSASELLNNFRFIYVNQLKTYFSAIIVELSSYKDITLEYQAGWNENFTLQEILDRGFERDCFLGYTQAGPQKADLVIKYNTIPIIDIFSRGEQKLVVYALKLAQGMLLRAATDKNCSYLIDDLAAELDIVNQHKVLESLTKLKSQIIITSVQNEASITNNPEINLINIKDLKNF